MSSREKIGNTPPEPNRCQSAPPPTGAELAPVCPVVLSVLLLACIVALLWAQYPMRNTWQPDCVWETVAESFSPDGRVDLNRADKTALCCLPGIGAVKAEAILAWRRQNGTFDSPEQLLQIEGISEKTYRGLLPYVSVSSGAKEAFAGEELRIESV